MKKLIEDAYIHGGNAPNDISGWVHAGQSVAADFMSEEKDDTPGAFFVYDGTLLTTLSQAERDAARENPLVKHTFMHAQRPIGGLELKDTLIGIIAFDTPDHIQDEN
jgi:hypothetical protein